MSIRTRLAAGCDHLEEFFIAAALAVMTLLTFIQVVLRYLFHTGLVWSLEATTYTFGCLVIIGMAYCVRTRAHIAVDLLTRRFEPGARRLLAGLALSLSLVYCALMLYGSLLFVDGLMLLGHNAQDLPIRRWLLAAILPLGFVLLAARILQAGWRYFAPVDDPERRPVDVLE